MIQKEIIIISGSFPYGKGESFLINELEFTSKYFSEITIIPKYIGSDKRHVQNGIHVVQSGMTIFKKLGYLFQILFWKLFWIELIKSKSLLNPHLFSFIVNESIIALNFKSLLEKYINPKGRKKLPLIYSYWMGGQVVGAILLKKQFPRLKVISRAHGSDLYEGDTYSFLPFRDFVYRQINKIICISDFGKNYLLKRYKIKRNVIVSRLGSPKSQNVLRFPGKCLIVTCAFIEPVKRFDRIINVFQELVKLINGPIEWIHIGSGTQEKYIKNMAHEKLPTVVKTNFMGYINNNLITETFMKIKPSILLSMSESEGIPVSMMEAQSVGLPVIATNVGGVQEIVNDSNGYLINHLDYKEIAQHIKRFVNDKDYWTKKSNASFKNWQSKYFDVRNYDDFYKRI